MCPTRELANQVANEEAIKLAPSSKFRMVAVYGGAPACSRQLEQLSPAAATSSSAPPAGCSTTFAAAR